MAAAAGQGRGGPYGPLFRNVGDYDKRTALHLACASGHIEIARSLLPGDFGYAITTVILVHLFSESISGGVKAIFRKFSILYRL